MFRRRPNIARLERRQDTRGLVAALSYRDIATGPNGQRMDFGTNVRSAAARTLAGSSKDPLVAPALVEVLRRNEDPTVLISLVEGLDGRPDDSVIEALVRGATTWVQPSHRELRARTLDRLRALPADSLPTITHALVNARVPEPLAPEEIDVLRQVLAAEDATASVAAKELIRHLGSDQPGVVHRASEALVELSPRGEPEILGALSDDGIAAQITEVIARRRGVMSAEALVDLLDSADPQLRTSAALALGELGDPLAAEPLLRAVNDQNAGVRAAAAAAVDKLGSVAVIASMGNVLRPLIGMLGEPVQGPLVTGESLHLGAGQQGDLYGGGVEESEDAEFVEPADTAMDSGDDLGTAPGPGGAAAPPPGASEDEAAARLRQLEPELERLRGLEPELQRLRALEPEVQRLRALEPEVQRLRALEPEVQRLRGLEPQLARLSELERAAARAAELEHERAELERDNARLKQLLAEEMLRTRSSPEAG